MPVDVSLIRCTYCETALAVDGGSTLFRVVLPPTLDEHRALDHLRRFMAGSQTVSGLDTKASMHPADLAFFPFWAFQTRTDSAEQTILHPAAPTSLQGVHDLALPPGEEREWSESLVGNARIIEPDIPIGTARTWLQEQHPEVEVSRTALYHLPLFQCAYDYRGRTYRAAVDGVSGRIYSADFPAKAEAPFFGIAALALGLFTIEGLVISDLWLKALVYGLTAVPILFGAWVISRKV